MTKFTTAIAAVALALVASTPAFANRAGGPDLQNPIVKDGVAPSQGNAVIGWAGNHYEIQPGVSVEALTGTVSDPTETYHVGRLTYRVLTPQPADATGFASAATTYSVN